MKLQFLAFNLLHCFVSVKFLGNYYTICNLNNNKSKVTHANANLCGQHSTHAHSHFTRSMAMMCWPHPVGDRVCHLAFIVAI